ncbi:hypothetical protein ACFSQ7_51500 [Paenibacillus rhizoplanae]
MTKAADRVAVRRRHRQSDTSGKRAKRSGVHESTRIGIDGTAESHESSTRELNEHDGLR